MHARTIAISIILLASGLAGTATTKATEASGGDGEEGLQATDGRAEGRWISMAYQNDTGEIDDFEVDGLRYFSSIQSPGAFQIEIQGDRLVFTGDGFQVDFHDHPRGVVSFVSDEENFTLSPGWGVATYQENNTVRLTHNHNTAYLMGGERQNREVILTDGTFFRVGPEAGVLETRDGDEDPFLQELDALAAEGQVAAWARVDPKGIHMRPLAGFDYETQIVRDLHHRLVLQSLPENARFFILEIERGHMDPDSVRLRHYEKMLSLLVPGDEIPAKQTLGELLAEDEDAAYWAQQGLHGIRIVVVLGPGESQGVEIIGTTSTVPPGITVGLLLGALGVIGGTGYFFWDRWRMRKPW